MKDNERQEIEKFGQLQENGIFTMTIIGEIEGHQLSAQNAKTTKYEHMIPALAKVEQDESHSREVCQLSGLQASCSVSVVVIR